MSSKRKRTASASTASDAFEPTITSPTAVSRAQRVSKEIAVGEIDARPSKARKSAVASAVIATATLQCNYDETKLPDHFFHMADKVNIDAILSQGNSFPLMDYAVFVFSSD
jgi:hypothetical protein